MLYYKIVRNYLRRDLKAVKLRGGLTLEQAQAHCSSPETSSTTAVKPPFPQHLPDDGSAWFDGYEVDTERMGRRERELYLGERARRDLELLELAKKVDSMM